MVEVSLNLAGRAGAVLSIKRITLSSWEEVR